MEAKRKVAVSITVMVVLLTTLLATITPVNFTNVLAQDPVSSLTPWVYLPYISRQGSPTSEPISTSTATGTSTPTNTATATNTPTATPSSTTTATPTDTPTSTATATNTPTAVPEECDVHEPNDVPDQANTAQAGETQTDCIVPEIDVDWWVFSVTTESEVIIEVLGDGGSGDLSVKLYDNNLNLIESDIGWDGTDAQIDRLCGTGWDPLPAGTYYVSVEDFLNNDEIIPYDISLAVTPCPSVVVLANHSSYADLDFLPHLFVVGEIQNNGLIGIMWPRVVVNLFNDSDQLIDTDIATTYLAQSVLDSALSPDDKTCFLAQFTNFDGWAYYEFEAPTYSSTGDSLENMTIYGDNGTYDSGDGSYRILGFVRNDNEVTVTDVDLIGTLYDVGSTVVGCGTIGANNDNLAPGQSSSFELTFSGYYRDYADVDSYRLQVDGMPQ